MKSTQGESTRNAILDALAAIMLESDGFGFSMQQVADRAGVTHRTVYNHFPARDALTAGLATYTEELLGTIQPDPGASMTLNALAHTDFVDQLYHLFAKQAVAVRAYAMS